jgi:hypothetical protein
MVRFALDSRMAFREEVDKLAEKLGPKTRDLATRTGLHSGPVTGGVLRGEKVRFLTLSCACLEIVVFFSGLIAWLFVLLQARFQLFGDVSLDKPP